MTQPEPGSEPDTTGNPYAHADDDEPEQRPVDTLNPGEYL